MLDITKDELKNALENDKRSAVRIKRGMAVSSLALLILSIAGFMAADRIAGNSSWWMLVFIAFMVLIVMILRIIPYFIMFIDTSAKQGAGHAFRNALHMHKYKQLYPYLRTEICSDSFLSSLDTFISSEKNAYELFQLNIIKFYTHVRRCEQDKAEATAETLESSYSKKMCSEIDMLSIRLNRAYQYGTAEEYLGLVRDNAEVLEIAKHQGLDSALSYLNFAALEKKLTGDLNGALELMEMSREYCLDKFNTPLVAPQMQQQFNYSRYQSAHMLLDTAELLFEAGNIARCRQVLEESESMIKLVKCSMPEMYARDHKSLIEKLRVAEKE